MGPTAEAPEAARGPTPPLTTAASGRASGLYPHLQLAARRMRRHTPCYAHLSRRTPLPRIGPYSTCDDTAAAARGTPLPPTTAASGGDLRLYPHLRFVARRTRRGLTCEGKGGYAVAARTVGSMTADRSGRRGCAPIAAADHHGRL